VSYQKLAVESLKIFNGHRRLKKREARSEDELWQSAFATKSEKRYRAPQKKAVTKMAKRVE